MTGLYRSSLRISPIGARKRFLVDGAYAVIVAFGVAGRLDHTEFQAAAHPAQRFLEESYGDVAARGGTVASQQTGQGFKDHSKWSS